MDSLTEQKRVSNLFNPIKDRFDGVEEKRKIEEIEFIFKNACYNKNRMIEGISHVANPPKRVVKSVMNNIKDISATVPRGPDGKILFLRVPMIFWRDRILFEFHSYLENIMRAVNFLLNFKLEFMDGRKATDNKPTIGQFLSPEREKKYKSTIGYSFFRTNYEGWLESIDKLRQKVIHKEIEKKMSGELIYKLVPEDVPLFEPQISMGVKTYDIASLATFAEEKLDLLETFITEFFDKYLG